MSTATPSAFSGNTALLSNDVAHVSFGGSGTNRTLIITPVANQYGAVPISVSVSDGSLTTTQSFVLEVRQNTNVVLVDNFTYDGGGALDLLSGGLWSNYSGHTNEMIAGSGVVTIDGVNHTEDVNAPLIGAPYATNSGTVLYSSFVLNYSTMPDATGSYFAYFKDTSTGNFLCRVWAFSNSPATYRIAIASATNAIEGAVQFPQDLYPGTNYVVVTRLDLSTWNSTVWINPGSASSPSATDTAAISTTATNITDYAFRESTADEGILTLSNLTVGTSFNSVIFPPQANPDSYAVAENSVNNPLSPLTNDVSGGTLSLVSVSPTNGTAAISGTQVLFTPASSFVGTAIIGYTITDNLGGTNRSLITVTVTNVPPGTIVPTVPPRITAFSIASTNLVITGTNAQATGVYYLLASTNVALPLHLWTPVATNVIGTTNNFTFTGTNVVLPGGRQQFYILSSTNN
jgi:hypothetical protein